MAMTKKEKAEMNAAIYKAELLAALRWTQAVEKDVPPPDKFGEYTQGWEYNAYSQRVYEAWSGTTNNGTGKAPVSGCEIYSALQNKVWLYSTKEKAIAAMRNEIEVQCAKKLLEYDRAIR